MTNRRFAEFVAATGWITTAERPIDPAAYPDLAPGASADPGSLVFVGTAGPVPLVAEVTPAALHELGLAAGDEAWVALKATEVHVYPR